MAQVPGFVAGAPAAIGATGARPFPHLTAPVGKTGPVAFQLSVGTGVAPPVVANVTAALPILPEPWVTAPLALKNCAPVGLLPSWATFTKTCHTGQLLKIPTAPRT